MATHDTRLRARNLATHDTRLRDISHATTDLHDALIRRDLKAAHHALDNGASPTASYHFRDFNASFLAGGRTLGGPESMQCSPLCLALGAADRFGSGRDRSARRRVQHEPGLRQMIGRLLALGADPNDDGNECQDDGSGGYFDPHQAFSPLKLARDRGVASEIVAVLERAGATVCAQEAQNERTRQQEIATAKKTRAAIARMQKDQKPPAKFSSAQVLALYKGQQLVAQTDTKTMPGRLATSAPEEESFVERLLHNFAPCITSITTSITR